MMNLTTADAIRIVTSVAADVDVFASYVDKDGTTDTPGNQATQITAAATTTVVSAPGAGQRNVNLLTIVNRDTSDSVIVTVQFFDGAATEIISEGIGPGGALTFNDQGQWSIKTSGLVTKTYLTTPGAGTYTTPIAVTALDLELLGNGGNGGNCTTAATNSAAGGGGGGGEYVTHQLKNPAESYGYFVGAAGDAGTCWGGFTGVSSIAVATGASGVGGTDAVATLHVGGAGGFGAGYDFRFTAQGGTGLALAAAQAVSGCGGSPAMYGAGGNSRKTQGAGNAGLGYGAGGGGGCILSGGAAVAGGAGTGGLIIVTEYR